MCGDILFLHMSVQRRVPHKTCCAPLTEKRQGYDKSGLGARAYDRRFSQLFGPEGNNLFIDSIALFLILWFLSSVDFASNNTMGLLVSEQEWYRS